MSAPRADGSRQPRGRSWGREEGAAQGPHEGRCPACLAGVETPDEARVHLQAHLGSVLGTFTRLWHRDLCPAMVGRPTARATGARIQACATGGGAEQGVGTLRGARAPSVAGTIVSHPHPLQGRTEVTQPPWLSLSWVPQLGSPLPSIVATLIISPENKPDIDGRCFKPFQTSLLSKNSSPNKALAVWPCLPSWEHLPDPLTISGTGLQWASFRCTCNEAHRQRGSPATFHVPPDI